MFGCLVSPTKHKFKSGLCSASLDFVQCIDVVSWVARSASSLESCYSSPCPSGIQLNLC